ncbi:hypothetical protein CAPTEDRAFT_188724 [Capitella teleta]|uniref:Uncharacterized protein n=1 Tax=Capitella teleta TaxID=283909 RepID=R7T6M0_CAPTE|nr:hypothetical protein CAPTEDRAFT_188724 [Capitella teleta]|eukprot:ELT89008.1 hypothetical protein CAPTEDRAFT_188724 [Capitella teleta]
MGIMSRVPILSFVTLAPFPNAMIPSRRFRQGAFLRFLQDFCSDMHANGAFHRRGNKSCASVRSKLLFDLIRELQQHVKPRRVAHPGTGNCFILRDGVNDTPESDLENYANFVDHLRTDYGYDSGCFTPASRPHFIRELYSAAVPTPVKVLRTCNILRTDGKTGSKIFSVPLVLEDEQDVPPILEEPKPMQPNRHYEKIIHSLVPPGAPSPRAHKTLKEPRPHSVPVISDLDAGPVLECSTLPSPRRRLQDISRSQPVTLVPINTSGSGFQRLCDYRESIRSSSREYLDEGTDCRTTGRSSTRRKKGSSRRLTVTGVPGHVADELRDSGFFQVTQPSAEIHSRSASRDRWERPRSCMGMHDQYTPRSSMHCDSEDGGLARSCSLRRSLRSLFKDRRAKSQDLWVTGSPRPPGPPVVDLRMGRLMRSTSLPRSLKSVVKDSFGKLSFERSASTEGRLDSRTDELPSTSIPSSSSSPSSGLPPPQPKKSAIRKIKEKLKLTKSSGNKSHDKLPRSQSHHADLHSPASSSRILDPGGGSMRRPKSMELRPRSRMSRSQSALESIRVKTPVSPVEKSVGSPGLTSGGRHVHVNIPSQPWTKPFADVKLRGNGTGKEDGNSSSGHWSASSGRQSFDSEVRRSSKLPPSGSENSVDRDSAVCLRETPLNAKSSEVVLSEEAADDDASTIVGDGDLDDADEASTPVVGKRRISIDDDMPSSRSSSEERSSSKHVRGLTLENLLQHELDHNGHSRVRRPYLCDDESSVYSVDQDGFFTSMHQDSGLKRGIMDMDASSVDNFSQTSSSTSSKAKRGSSSFLAMLPGSLRRRKSPKKAPPPAPPPRNSQTTLHKSNLKLDVDCLTPQSSPSVELQRLAAVANKVAAQEERRARLGLDPESSRPIDLPPPGSSQDSDTDSLIQIRVRKKSSISSHAAYPSLVSVTPSNSEEEDLDFIDFKSAWRNKDVPGISSSNSLKSSKSAPGELLPNGRPRSFSQVSCNGTMECIEENSHESSTDDSFVRNDSSRRDSSGFSTWPRSPSQKEIKKQANPKALPQASTPQKGCERSALTSINSFNENPQAPPSIAATPQSGKGDIVTIASMPSKSHYANSKIISAVSTGSPGCSQQSVACSAPVPASARLIITSPVSNKAAFVQNPHKRSVCSPVSDEDFQKFSGYSSSDKWCNELPRSTSTSREITPPREQEPKINKPLLKKSSTAFDFTQEKLDSVLRDSTQLSNPLYPTMKAMKHSVSFSSAPEKKIPESYGKSWYEGIRPTAEPKEVVAEVHAPPKTPSRVSFTSFMKNSTDATVPSTGMGVRRGSNASTISSGSSGSAGKRQVFATIHRQPTTPVAHAVLEAESKPVTPPDVTERLRELTPEKPEARIDFPTFPRASSAERKVSSQSRKGYSQNRHRHSVVSNDSASTSISAPGDFISPSSAKAATERKSSTLEKLKAPVKTEVTPQKTKSAFETIKSTRKKLNESTESEDTHIGSDHELDIPTPMPLLTSFSSKGSTLFKPPSDPTSICSVNPQTPLAHESRSATLPHRRKVPDVLPVTAPDTKVTTKPTPLKFVWPPVSKASACKSSQSARDSNDSSSPVVQRTKERSRSVTSLEGQLPLSVAQTELTQSTTNLSKMNGSPVENGLSNGLDNGRSLSNLSYASNLSLYRSSVSLAGSNDSLASNASLSAERTRASKLAFLGSTPGVHEQESVDDRFAKHALSRSRSSLSSSRGNLSSISETKTVDIHIESSGSRSPSSYVTSLVGQFQRKSSPTNSVSSGLGSSLTSPCSPPPSPTKPVANNNNILKNSDYRAMIGSKTPFTKRDSAIIDPKQRDH